MIDYRYREYLPDTYHFLEQDVLEKLLTKVGFTIEKIEYFARPDYPAIAQADGREDIGAIGVKK